MYKVDQDFTNAVVAAKEKGWPYRNGKRSIKLDFDKKVFDCAYFDDGKHPDGSIYPQDNVVFHFNRESNDYWLSNCGWNSRTTVNLINDCLSGIGSNYKVFISKDRFCIRNTKFKKERILGDGKISFKEIIAGPWYDKVK